jgi:phenylalanyl-tRNA synthetase beta chain
LGLNDAVFEVKTTPDRPDLMCVMGIARELASYLRLPFSMPESTAPAAGGATADRISVTIEDPERCPRYVARVASIRMGPSPEWMQRRLTLAGLRPISNVVDVTNYVLLERNQPLHAFDLAKLGGAGILVRRANDGETMTTLDDVDRTLTADDLLICDAEGVPQAVAGIMGGSNSEIDDTTTEILLESAYFDPTGVYRTSKRLGLRSESSARFARGIDPNAVAAAAERAVELLIEVADATVVDGAVDVYPSPRESVMLTVRTARANGLLGLELTSDTLVDLLVPLVGEPTARSETEATFAIPTSRPDLVREVDLIEEVARHYGIDNIPRTLPNTTGHQGGLSNRQKARRRLIDACLGAGCNEAFIWPFVGGDEIEAVGLDPAGSVSMANPLRAEAPLLRQTLRVGLLNTLARNQGLGLHNVAFFELARVFRPPTDGDLLPVEREHLGVVLAGVLRTAPVTPDRPVDVYDAVDVLRAACDALRLAHVRLVPEALPGLHPSRGARVIVDGADLGVVGEIDAGVCAALNLQGPVVYAEVDAGALYDADRLDEAYVPVSRFPANRIDLAFVIDDATPARDLIWTLRNAADGYAESVEVFDEFRSESLGVGQRSVAYAIVFRAPDRTLDDAEMAKLRDACIAAVQTEHGSSLRA